MNKLTTSSGLFKYRLVIGNENGLFVKGRLERKDRGLVNALIPMTRELKNRISELTTGSETIATLFLIEFALEEIKRQQLSIHIEIENDGVKNDKP
jgi:hypothetical protein